MPDENIYTKIYRELPDHELLEAIEHPQNFDPLAVEAAHSEMDKRNLSQSELDAARQLTALGENELRKIKTATESSFKTAAKLFSPVLAKWRQIKIEYPSSFVLWAVTSVLIAGVYIYYFQSGFSTIKFYLFNGPDFSIGDFSLIALPFIVFSAGIVLQMLNKRLGWFLLIVYFATNFFGYLSNILYYQFFNNNPLIDPYAKSRILSIDYLFLSTHLILIVLLTKSGFRKIYKIGQLSVFFSIICPALFIYLMWLNILDAYALPVLLALLLIAVVWFKMITRKPKIKFVSTYPLDHQIFDEITSEPDLKQKIVDATQSLTNLHKLLRAEKKQLFKSSYRPEILKMLQSFGDDKRDYLQLIDDYKSIYHEDITSELMKISSSFAAIKENLEPFIRFGIIEAEYPHKLIEI